MANKHGETRIAAYECALNGNLVTRTGRWVWGDYGFFGWEGLVAKITQDFIAMKRYRPHKCPFLIVSYQLGGPRPVTTGHLGVSIPSLRKIDQPKRRTRFQEQKIGVQSWTARAVSERLKAKR